MSKDIKGSVILITSAFFSKIWDEQEYGDKYDRTWFLAKVMYASEEKGSDRPGYAIQCFEDTDKHFMSETDVKKYSQLPSLD